MMDKHEQVTTSLLEALTHRVPIMSDQQIARAFLPERPNSLHDTRKLMQELFRMNLVCTSWVMVPRPLSLDEPVLTWNATDPLPNFHRVAYRLRVRWKDLHPERTLICGATESARTQFNGTVGGRRLRAVDIRHDLCVTELWLKIQRESPELASTWVHEQTMTRRGLHNDGGKIPDAFIAGRAHDFAGSYKAEKLIANHRYFSKLGGYTLW